MQCSVMWESGHNREKVKQQTCNSYKNPYKKESNLDHIVDQLCTRLQDIKDQKGLSQVGMPTCSFEQAEAVRRYYAAFPALKKGHESPLYYYMPPPSWCRKPETEIKNKMQSELSVSKEHYSKSKKFSSNKERRNSYHGPKKNSKKRCNSYSKSFESKESLPEWFTHEGVWDMELQDPVKEFIRAIALDEGYGTCENTVTDEVKEISEVKLRKNENMVPDWDDSLDFESEWVINEDFNKPKVVTPLEEEYAKFEAKFDRSIEALWSKDQNTPDDEYQELPIDFQDLLSSPSDHIFADPSVEKCSLISLTDSIWSNDPGDANQVLRAESPSTMAEGLHDRFRPLRIVDVEATPPAATFPIYDWDIYGPLSAAARSMHSLALINHSREQSSFAEVPPRVTALGLAPTVNSQTMVQPPPPEDPQPREDLLTSSRTHFRPIRRETEPVADPHYSDGDSFDICSELEPVEFHRSESGGVYLKSSLERYLEYRSSKSIDYGRLNLTAEQRCPDLDDPGFRLRFPVRQRDVGVQTDVPPNVWSLCECRGAPKKKRSSIIDADGIWADSGFCSACAPPAVVERGSGRDEDLSQDWEELMSDISVAYAGVQEDLSAGEAGVTGVEGGENVGAGRARAVDGWAGGLGGVGGADRKRRHSVALRCTAACPHPHARFLHCCPLDRPLTR